MIKEIQPFDITQHIREKVRHVLISSIPDEQMDKLIKIEFDRYFAKTSAWEGSPFSNLVHKFLDEKITEILKEYLNKNLPAEWSELNMYELTGDVVKKLAPLALEGLARSMVAGIVEKMKLA